MKVNIHSPISSSFSLIGSVLLLMYQQTTCSPSLVPRPSPAPVFDRLQYAKTEPEGLVNLTT